MFRPRRPAFFLWQNYCKFTTVSLYTVKHAVHATMHSIYTLWIHSTYTLLSTLTHPQPPTGNVQRTAREKRARDPCCYCNCPLCAPRCSTRRPNGRNQVLRHDLLAHLPRFLLPVRPVLPMRQEGAVQGPERTALHRDRGHR